MAQDKAWQVRSIKAVSCVNAWCWTVQDGTGLGVVGKRPCLGSGRLLELLDL